MIRDQLDQRIEKRMTAVLEPRMEEWLHRFFRTDSGEALISEVIADFLLSWLRPDSAQSSYFEKTLLEIVGQLARDDAEFRDRVVATLNPHWTEHPPK